MTDTVTIMRDGELIEVPAESVFVPEEPSEPQVPQSVTPAQAKLALAHPDWNLYATAKALVYAEGSPVAFQIMWESASEWRIDDPRVITIATALELDLETDLPALFTLAATL